MCGIVAIFAKQKIHVGSLLFKGLSQLQNRGYDSVGICTLNQEKFVLNRAISIHGQSNAITRLEKCIAQHQMTRLGIAHSRWATHGEKTIANAHPHIVGQVALVHNGIIENYTTLKAMLSKHYIFKSETDTEVIAALLDFHLSKSPASVAIPQAFSQLEGSWAVAFLIQSSPSLFIAKKGQPLVVMETESHICVASEISGFPTQTTSYSLVRDYEIVELNIKASLFPNAEFWTIGRQQKFPQLKILHSPSPFSHWTLREIVEQKDIIQDILHSRLQETIRFPELEKFTSLFQNCEHLLFLGCGTSHHSGLLASQYAQWLSIVDTAQAIDASEFTSDCLPLSCRKNPSKAIVICISQSGETKDVHKSLSQLHSPSIALVNVVDSWIARSCTTTIYLNAGREVGVASTKAFTGQVITLILILLWIAHFKAGNKARQTQLVKDLKIFQSHIAHMCIDRPEYTRIGEELVKHPACFLLGRGLGYSIAKESALKLKEIGYIHAQGYAAGALKHGPFALIEPGTVIVLLATSDLDDHLTQFYSTAEEVCSRKAKIIWITDRKMTGKNEIVHVPCAGVLTPLLANIACQFIAFHLSIAKDINPDFPRNLAKVVTVDG